MIVNKFAEMLAKRKLNKRDVVRITGLDNHTINRLYKGETSRVELKTLDLICYALECNVEDIFYYTPER